jgi:hypothetical protein
MNGMTLGKRRGSERRTKTRRYRTVRPRNRRCQAQGGWACFTHMRRGASLRANREKVNGTCDVSWPHRGLRARSSSCALRPSLGARHGGARSPHWRPRFTRCRSFDRGRGMVRNRDRARARLACAVRGAGSNCATRGAARVHVPRVAGGGWE